MPVQEGADESSWWAPHTPDHWVGPRGDPDRYRVLGTAAAGGEGRLLRGELDLDGNPIPVAIKILHDDQEDLGEWERRWTRQTEILRTVSHPSLVGVREVFVGADPHLRGDPPSTGNRLYLVMNWAAGERLDTWAKGRPAVEVIAVLGALAEAVDYLHSGRGSNGVGVIHRDIKPANVIVSAGRPILVDFGFARFVQGADETVVVYSRSFAAPEVVRGDPPDPSSDRFAFAASAVSVLTGLVPSRSSTPEVSQALADAGVPQALAAHLLATLVDDPRLRPPDLSPWYTPVDGAPVPITPPPPAVPTAAAHSPSTVMRSPADPVTETAQLSGSEPGTTSNIGNVMTLLAGALLVVAAVAIGVWLLVTGPGEEVVIPEVVGLSLEDATAAFEEADVHIVPEPVSSDADIGSVVSVSPRAGTSVDRGTDVVLQYASKSYTMPDLDGVSISDAVEELTSLGAEQDLIELRASPVEDDRVWCSVGAQVPDPGVRYNRTARVLLEVAVAPADDVEDCLPSGG